MKTKGQKEREKRAASSGGNREKKTGERVRKRDREKKRKRTRKLRETGSFRSWERKNKEKAASEKGARAGSNYETEEELIATIIAYNLTRNSTVRFSFCLFL